MRTLTLIALVALAGWAEGLVGTWLMDSARSTFTGETRPKRLTARIETHSKGEVLTLETVAGDGRATTSSSILYLDAKPREFQDDTCSGTQTSRRTDKATVEVVRNCQDGGWIRLVLRMAAQPNKLTLEITKQPTVGPHVEWRLSMEKR